MGDYRNTDSCPSLEKISEKKSALVQGLSRNHYLFVQKGSGKQEFAKIYNHKCAYCGVLTDIKRISCFQIDHIVCKTSERWKEKEGKDDISNLAFSCEECNQSKHDFEITSEYDNVLNPDYGLGEVFTRDENSYAISISDCYKNDETIKSFYRKMHFDSTFRRIDYLLVKMHRLKENQSISEELSEKIGSLYLELLEKVNNSIWSFQE